MMILAHKTYSYFKYHEDKIGLSAIIRDHDWLNNYIDNAFTTVIKMSILKRSTEFTVIKYNLKRTYPRSENNSHRFV